MIVENILKLYEGNTSEKLEVLKDLTEQQLKIKINSDTIPNNLEYIVTNVVMVRFSRIGSEGYSSESIGGMSISYLTPTSDFEPYIQDITDYLNSNNLNFRKGQLLIF